MLLRLALATGLLASLALPACKQAQTGGDSDLNADAAAVASGQEVLLSRNSKPEPVLPPKAKAEDFDSELYQLETKAFSRLSVGDFQVAGSDLTGTPRALQGIWWMDGNPLSDETVSFANVDFSQRYPLLPVYMPNNFTFHGGESGDYQSKEADHNDKAGAKAFGLAKNFSLIYEFHFENDGKDYSRAYIIPTVKLKVGPFSPQLRLSKQILEFQFIQTDEHTYERSHTVARGRPIDASYTFRRILIPSASDPKVLEKTIWWDLYVAQKGPPTLRLPVKR